MATNPDFRVDHRDGADRVAVTPLDAVNEPASLVGLRAMVEALLPEVEIAALPLEVHGWTGFLDEYTHISGAPSRAGGLTESASALLVADSCNVGLTPVVDEDYPPLSRHRLNWTAQNYFRSATHTGASTRLFDYHAHLDLARNARGGGEMASADGMRFVIPVSTIHAGYNPRYFGRQRGSTLYTWMADTHASFHQTLIPGTQRDSLYALDGLMANQTVVRPETVSTDTAGASEIVFALAWTLGYRYAPAWPTWPTIAYGGSTRRPTTGRSRAWPATASTQCSSPASGTRSAASPPPWRPGPSPPRRSCGPYSADRTLPAWAGRWPNSDASSRPSTSSTTATTRNTGGPSTASSAGAKTAAYPTLGFKRR
jgi:hypothetical protein